MSIKTYAFVPDKFLCYWHEATSKAVATPIKHREQIFYFLKHYTRF